MASKRIILFFLVLCMSHFHRGNAQELKVGDPIPSFNPCGWLNASPIQELERGKVYVIAFWASWCGPCIAGMPHVSDLSEQLKGKAEFIAVNTSDWSSMGLGIATRADSAFALNVIRSKLDDPNETDEEMYGWCAKLMSFVNMTRDKSLLPSALSMSEQCVRNSPASERCLAAMYHARSLAHVGRFEEAEKYIKISLEAVDSFEPATRRTSIRSSMEKEANKIRESLASAKIE